MSDAENQFYKDLTREDDVGLVLRGHLHIEHQLIELISTLLSLPACCDWSNINYRAKIELAYGCGLHEDLISPLKQLGSIRNGFAHTLKASLSKKSILDLYNSMSPRLQDGLKVAHKAIGIGELTNPLSLEPRDLLILIFVNIRQAIAAAICIRRNRHS
ncbi:MAG TPA: hypothetical protein VG962_05335 [Steroidobacteraceae bacterium]|nr:hypothetical protein [Steroidobacteraceae bacterium]